MNKQIPFESIHNGNCPDCEEKKSLDSMVRKNYDTEKYHCIDCKTEEEIKRYLGDDNITISPIAISKIQKLLAWCFG